MVRCPLTKPLFEIKVRGRVPIEHFYDGKTPEPALAARQLNRYLSQQLQFVEIPFSELNDASALSRN